MDGTPKKILILIRVKYSDEASPKFTGSYLSTKLTYIYWS